MTLYLCIDTYLQAHNIYNPIYHPIDPSTYVERELDRHCKYVPIDIIDKRAYMQICMHACTLTYILRYIH